MECNQNCQPQVVCQGSPSPTLLSFVIDVLQGITLLSSNFLVVELLAGFLINVGYADYIILFGDVEIMQFSDRLVNNTNKYEMHSSNS